MKTVILIGAPGAGKDTIANQFQNNMMCNTISPGAIYRREAQLGTPMGLKAKNEYWGKGKLCPDEITNSLIKSTIDRLTDKKSDVMIFNGYPRSMAQAEFLSNIVDVDLVIDLDVSKDTATKRLLARRREDDTKEVIDERFVTYNEHIRDVMDFYKSKGVYHKINANQMVSRVWKDTLGAFNSTKE